ncbi:MAG TPA: hypothetical protein VMZ06_13490 [Candidatus Bathyarchaeia archaeon]|nr:hypothetical protein [Candidatus Bathyarchaeia archaeon]
MRMWCAVACLTAIASMAAAQVIEVPLTYMKVPEDRETYIPSGGKGCELTDKPGGQALILPDLPKQKIRYASFKLGDTEFPLIVARSIKGKEFTYSLYIDANRNGSVADETPLTASTMQENEYVYANLPPYDLQYQLGEKTLPFSVRFYVFEEKPNVQSALSSGRSAHITVVGNAGYTGEFTAKEKKYKIVVGDTEFNGNFGDKLVLKTEYSQGDSIYYGGDTFLLSTGGEKPSYFDSVHVTDYLMLGKDLYKVAMDTANSKLTLTSADVARVPLKIPKEVQRLEIISADNTASIAFLAPGTVVNIPAGSYKMTSYLTARTEPVGDVWLLAARATGRTPACAVDGSGSAVMTFGEPYTAQLNSQHLQKGIWEEGKKPVYRLEMSVAGTAHEQVAMVQHKSGDKTKFPLSERNPNSPKEPTYKIVTEEGETLASGSFEYG